MKYYPISISIKKVENCFFSRRNGIIGKIILGYSISVLIFGKEVFKKRNKK